MTSSPKPRLKSSKLLHKGGARATALVLLLGISACEEPPPPPPKELTVAQVHALIKNTSRNRTAGQEWAQDIKLAFSRLGLLANKNGVCATIAVIEQESTFNARPDIPGLGRMVLQKLESPDTHLAVRLAAKARLLQTAHNGKRFDAYLAQVKTELDLEKWYDEFTGSQLTSPLLKWMGKDVDSLIATLGPMQVSVRFAREFSRRMQWPTDNLRPYLHTREGGILYGTAHLLSIPSSYSRMVYRFADFNAGPFASRNAGFQQMVSKLSGQTLDLDGDLLSYRKGQAQTSASAKAVISVLARSASPLAPGQIEKDLGLEKEAGFVKTPTYKAIADLYQSSHQSIIREAMPKIVLKSVKISRHLTTEWFATHVDAHYAKCVRTSV